MERVFSFQGTVKKFPGVGGWFYVPVPKKHTAILTTQRKAWGMYPIQAQVNQTVWKTKLMLIKGGNYFVALKASVRKKERIEVGDSVTVSIMLL